MSLNQPAKTILICSLFLIASIGYANQNSGANSEQAKISFYLPINKDQFPGITQKLKSALSQASRENANLARLDIITTDYWHPYQQGIRQGRPGIYFSAPHFASWLVNQHQFEPALRLSGTLQYVIVSRRSDSHIFEVGDLTNKTVCTNATMDISFLLVRESMARSILSADTLRVENVQREMDDNNRKCDAFSLSEHLFLKFALEDPFKFIRLQQSQEFSNYAYLFHPNTPSGIKEALIEFLVGAKATEILSPMYRLFAKEAKIVSGEPSDYPESQSMPLNPYWNKDLSISP